MSKLVEAFEKLLGSINVSCLNPAAFASMAAISSFSLNVFFNWLKPAMEMMRKGTVRMDLNDMKRVLKQSRALFIIELLCKST